jgi:DNA polymerase-1
MLLIDGSNLLHRGLHTDQQNLHDSKGRYTGGLHSFLQSLNKAVLKKRLKDNVVVAWDLGIPLFRRGIYKEYKPQKIPVGDVGQAYLSEQNMLKRTEGTDDQWFQKYISSRRLLHSQFLPLSGCISIQVSNCEADDIISYICHKLHDEVITIHSSDYDLFQLLSDNISVYDGFQDKITTKDSLIKDHSLNKERWRYHWLLARAIKGDDSDGIPGFTSWETAKKYADQMMEPCHSKLPLKDILTKLTRPPRSRVENYERLKAGEQMLSRNLKLIDLEYPLRLNLPIVHEIAQAIKSTMIYDIDPFTLESQLHSLEMKSAKVFVTNIIESNTNSEASETIRRMT